MAGFRTSNHRDIEAPWLKRAASPRHHNAKGQKGLVGVWRVTGSTQLQNLDARWHPPKGLSGALSWMVTVALSLGTTLWDLMAIQDLSQPKAEAVHGLTTSAQNGSQQFAPKHIPGPGHALLCLEVIHPPNGFEQLTHPRCLPLATG
eukprot:1158025-Pelagomonas_calceolata.AAC.5